MFRSELIRRLPRLQSLYSGLRPSSTSLDIEKIEKDSSGTIDVVDEEAVAREEAIQRKRNKSRLKEHDRNFLLEKTPYSEPQQWFQGTLKYVRRTYGRYGESSGVDPALCWPTKSELEESMEYERTAHPFTIPQMITEAKQKAEEKRERTRVRQEEIVKRMVKLEQWKQDLHDKINKKQSEANAAKARKERLMEEVRAHFGYTVDPKDEKFKEMIEKKEKEEKKAMKEARKKAREQEMVAKMLNKKSEKTKTVKEDN